jgi:putative spermidine/putrescine transport system permease protein
MGIGPFASTVLLGGPLVFLAMFFIVPFAWLALDSFQRGGAVTAANYLKLATDGYYWRTLLLTFEVSLWSTLLCFVLGYPVAYFLNFYARSKLARKLIYIILVTPLFTSNIVRAFGWIIMLGREGIINQSLIGLGIINAPFQLLYTKCSIVLALSYTLLPFMVLAISSVLQDIDRSVVEAARDLGANPVVTFLKVTFPLSIPGVVAGTLIVFTLAASAYVTPSIMSGGRSIVMPMLIFQQYMVVFDASFGAALSILLLGMTLLLIAAYSLLLNRAARRKYA